METTTLLQWSFINIVTSYVRQTLVRFLIWICLGKGVTSLMPADICASDYIIRSYKVKIVVTNIVTMGTIKALIKYETHTYTHTHTHTLQNQIK